MGSTVCSCNRDTTKETTFEKDDNSHSQNISLAKTVDPQTSKTNQSNFFMAVKIQRAYRRFIDLKKRLGIGVGRGETNQGVGGTFGISKGKSKNFEYFGSKIRGLKEGFGKQIWVDGAIYKGMFKNNQASGWGKFRQPEGDDYRGEFLNDTAHGYGLYINSKGAVYEGEWVNDNQSGIGCESWNDSSNYLGSYLNGKKHGYGVYLWQDGSKYEGEWFENNLHGYGIYYFIDDKIYIGNWINNSMNGYGEFFWNDGKRYAGFYVNDKKEGFGVYFWTSPQKRAYIGFWKDGKQHGVGKYLNQEKSRYGVWENGIRTNWYSSREEAFSNLNRKESVFTKMFDHNLTEIESFLNK